MKIVLATIIFLLFLLFFGVKIVFNISLRNFDFSAKVVIKFPFSKEIYPGHRKKKKRAAKDSNSKKSAKKIDLETIKKLKNPVTVVISAICGIIKKYCRVLKLETKILSALEDPMENGIAFGIISGVFNVMTLVLKEQCGIKKTELEILSDFDSGEGLIFEMGGMIKVRPVLMLCAIVFNKKLIREIKNISDILKREEN